MRWSRRCRTERGRNNPMGMKGRGGCKEISKIEEMNGATVVDKMETTIFTADGSAVKTREVVLKLNGQHQEA